MPGEAHSWQDFGGQPNIALSKRLKTYGKISPILVTRTATGRRPPGAEFNGPGHPVSGLFPNRSNDMADTTDAMDQAVKAMADREGKYLTFSLAEEEYGIGILKIKEIIGMMSITSVPRTPPYVKGVINLRGKVIPVIDLRLRFGLTGIDYNERTCIIVVEIRGQAGTILMGIVVDSVSEVLNIKAKDIEETPAFGASLDTQYILGMAKMEGGVKILLDIDRVVGSSDATLLAKMA